MRAFDTTPFVPRKREPRAAIRGAQYFSLGPAFAGDERIENANDEMMDLPLSDFRNMAVEEFDTTKLLAHASQQAQRARL